MARKKGWDIFIIIFLRFIYCGKIDLTNLLGFEWCLAQHSNVPQGRRFSVSGYARIGISYAKILSVINNENIYKLKFIPRSSRTDEEFVSKEDLATARLYFKRPGHIRRLFLDNWTHRTSGLEVYTVINSKHNIF
ncbi:unnamed protein product [Rhizophagus irregularis]|nr:unnamed protein product [Rhizophagus irregularis]